MRLPKGADRPHAMKDVSFAIASGEILCVVGESGSGKSMTANAVMRLLPGGVDIDGGAVLFDGKDLTKLTDAEMRAVRGAGIAMIFQEPMTALNPLRTIGDQIGEMFGIHTACRRPRSPTRSSPFWKRCASPIRSSRPAPIRTSSPVASASAP